jgi:hypothetical protein
MSAYLCRQTFFLLIKIQGIKMAKESVKFRYIGKNKDMNGVFGYDFSGGVDVEVTNEHAIGKLTNNSHFEIVKTGHKATQATEVIETPVAEIPEKIVEVYGVFRLKGDGSTYAKPDKVFTTVEADAQAYIDSFDDGKERVIRTKKMEAHK